MKGSVARRKRARERTWLLREGTEEVWGREGGKDGGKGSGARKRKRARERAWVFREGREEVWGWEKGKGPREHRKGMENGPAYGLGRE